MAHARRSLRNHHGKPHEHAPGDPLGVYLPPLGKWKKDDHGMRSWRHPELPLRFTITGSSGGVAVRYNDDYSYDETWFDGPNPRDVLAAMKVWYSQQTMASLRRAERNPDWSAMRAKASHYGSRAATGAREAYEWTAPRAKRAAAATWEGAKATGRAVKRGAKRAAPVLARGARSAAESMERWSQTNGRCAMRNGATQGRMILVGNKRLGGHILRYSGHYGDAASRTGLAFYNREAIPLKDARDALQDLKWMAGFDTIHGRAWQRGEKSVLATTIKGLEAAIARAK